MKKSVIVLTLVFILLVSGLLISIVFYNRKFYIDSSLKQVNNLIQDITTDLQKINFNYSGSVKVFVDKENKTSKYSYDYYINDSKLSLKSKNVYNELYYNTKVIDLIKKLQEADLKNIIKVKSSTRKNKEIVLTLDNNIINDNLDTNIYNAYILLKVKNFKVSNTTIVLDNIVIDINKDNILINYNDNIIKYKKHYFNINDKLIYEINDDYNTLIINDLSLNIYNTDTGINVVSNNKIGNINKLEMDISFIDEVINLDTETNIEKNVILNYFNSFNLNYLK